MPEKDGDGFVVTKITLEKKKKITLDSGQAGAGTAEGGALRICARVKAVLSSGKQTESEA